MRIEFIEELNLKFDIVYLNNSYLSENINLDENSRDFKDLEGRLKSFMSDKGYQFVQVTNNGKKSQKDRSYYYVFKKVKDNKILRAFIQIRISNHSLDKTTYDNEKNSTKYFAKKTANEYNQSSVSYKFISVNGYKCKNHIDALDYAKSKVNEFEDNFISEVDNYDYDGLAINANIKKNIKSITIKSGVTEIADYAFCNCYILESVKFPKSLIKIGSNAFKECLSLQELVLPKTINYIGESAFAECYDLKSVVILNKDDIKIDPSAFDDCNKLIIKCYKDTKVEKFCIDNSIQYKLL